MRATDEILKRVARNILTMRENFGMLQHQVAAALRIDKSTLSRWEHGLVDPGTSGLYLLAKFYGITVDELFDTEVPHPLMPEKEDIDEQTINAADDLDRSRSDFDIRR